MVATCKIKYMKSKNDLSQMELFQVPQKRIRSGEKKVLKNIEPDTNPEPRHIINISYENIIVSVISVLFLVILSFCLGVKRGEALLGQNYEREKTGEQNLAKVIPDQSLKEAPKERESTIDPKTDSKAVKIKKTPQIKRIDAKYTIQLITYSRKSQANKEVSKLSTAGIDAFYLVDGRYFKVYSGAYPDIVTAKKDIQEFKKNRWYKDCFVKKYIQ